MHRTPRVSYCFFSILLLPLSALALGWNLQYQDPNGRTLYGVKFVDQVHGWAVGAEGVILYTTNGGNSWDSLDSHTSNTLRGVSFVNATHGWAVGDSGTILRTTDGTTWEMQTSGTTNILRSVSFVDNLHGTAVGESGTILNTTDGGMNWLAQTSGTPYALNSVCFVDRNRGWAIGGRYAYPDTENMRSIILHTTNAGLNWINQNSNIIFPLYGLSFTDSLHGWIVGRYVDEIFALHSSIIHTDNGGLNWITQNIGGTLNDVSFCDTNHGLIACIGNTLYSSNGGEYWLFEELQAYSIQYGISLVDSVHGWAVGEDGFIQNFSGYTSVTDNDKILPIQSRLVQSYPNPFNSSTTIVYSLVKSSAVRIEVYDVSGRKISILVNATQNAGFYRVHFDGQHLPSGVYFCRFMAGKNVQTRKLILMR